MRKEKIFFLGREVEVNVVDDKDIDEAEAAGEHHDYLVVRCVDADPTAGSPDLRARRRRTPCEGCGEICWIDPKAYEPVARLKHTILCAQCMMKKVKDSHG